MNEFSIGQLTQYIRSKKRVFILNTIIGVALGFVVAYSIPKTYTSKMSLAVESQRDTKIGGNMGALASMAGVNLGSSEDAISPELYPDVFSTNKFLIDLLRAPVQTTKGKKYKSYVDYTQAEERSTWWSSAIKGAVAGVKHLFGNKVTQAQFPQKDINPSYLTLAEEQIVDQIRSSVSCSVDKETNVITIRATAQDPLVAKMLTDDAQKRLQDFITEYRTNKARTDYAYYVSLEKQLRGKYKAAQKKYASYADSHQSLELKSYETVLVDLENEMQNAFNAYTQMKQQVQMAEAKIQERTPVFTTIEDSYVPTKPVAPKKALILVAYLMISVLGTAGYYYLKLLFGKKVY